MTPEQFRALKPGDVFYYPDGGVGLDTSYWVIDEHFKSKLHQKYGQTRILHICGDKYSDAGTMYIVSADGNFIAGTYPL